MTAQIGVWYQLLRFRRGIVGKAWDPKPTSIRQARPRVDLDIVEYGGGSAFLELPAELLSRMPSGIALELDFDISVVLLGLESTRMF